MKRELVFLGRLFAATAYLCAYTVFTRISRKLELHNEPDHGRQETERNTCTSTAPGRTIIVTEPRVNWLLTRDWGDNYRGQA